jgi:hypothetical protein
MVRATPRTLAARGVYGCVYIDAVMGAAHAERAARRSALVCIVSVLSVLSVLSVALPFGLALTAWSPSERAAGAATTTTHANRSAANTKPKPKPLTAPKTTFAQDTKFFTDVTEADPSLVTYEQQHRNVALQALLTDGSAFCALLKRGGGIDQALVAEAEGARSTESRTSLPLSVATFNTIESVALLTLCPSEQKLVPASVRAKIRNLGDALAHRAG